MLKLYAPYWFDRCANPVGGTSSPWFFIAKDDADYKAFILSNKPRASKPNFMGNTSVDHYQLHGTAWLPGWLEITDTPTNHIDQYTIGLTHWAKFPYGWRPGRMESTGKVSLVIFQGQELRVSDTYYWQDTYAYKRACWADNGLFGYIQLSSSYSTSAYRYYVWTTMYVYRFTNGKLYRISDPVIPKAPAGFSYSGTQSLSFLTLYKAGGEYHEGVDTLLQYYMDWAINYYRSAKSTSGETLSILYTPGGTGEWNVQKFFPLKSRMTLDMMLTEPKCDLTLLLGDATQSAADAALKFTGNTVTLVKELVQLKDTLLDLYKLLKGDVSIKSLADLWLSARYGLKLTYQDTVDLAKSIYDEATFTSNNLYSWSRGGVGTNPIVRCKLYFDPPRRNAFAQAMAKLMEWDVFPSLANVWDIIPYSFVADWIVDIEGFLSAIDARTYLSVMEVFSTCYTYKSEWTRESSAWCGVFGEFRCSHFFREIPNEPYQPVPTFSGSLPSTKNVVDGTALIIQRL